MKKVFISACALLLVQLSFSQTFSVKSSSRPVDKKMEAALQYEDRLPASGIADYQIELFFIGGYWKGYKGYYKLLDSEGMEVYKSKEWSFGGFGGTAENKLVRKVIDKDLPKATKALKN